MLWVNGIHHVVGGMRALGFDAGFRHTSVEGVVFVLRIVFPGPKTDKNNRSSDVGGAACVI